MSLAKQEKQKLALIFTGPKKQDLRKSSAQIVGQSPNEIRLLFFEANI